jgi:hypothetical protein
MKLVLGVKVFGYREIYWGWGYLWKNCLMEKEYISLPVRFTTDTSTVEVGY